MRIGVPKEIKDNEYRVGLVPATVAELVGRGHQVAIETHAGEGAGIADTDYVEAGAEIAASASDVFARADLVIKVKEPLAVERAKLRPGQILFTYLHLAADRAQTEELLASGAIAIAYETVTDARGALPLLRPMSEVAGRMATQVGAQFLERPNGGRGILLGGVPGVAPAQVLVIGSGTVGTNAALIAVGMGADVTMMAPSADMLRMVAERFGTAVRTVASTNQMVESACRSADLVIGAALVPGAAAPKIISAATVKAMRSGAVIVDVAIDQGGIAETSRPTTHAQPTYVVDGVVHYCVANMPGAVPRTSTFALDNVTRPFVVALADKGLERALAEDVHLRNGLNVSRGKLTCRPVAEALRLPYVPADQVIGR
jgi:alanine dehydrogenase